MTLFERQMESYGSYHSHKTNQILHIIGTPFIIYSILAAASHVTITFFDHDVQGQWVIAAGLAVWYTYFHILYGTLAGLWILGLASLVPWVWEIEEPTRWIVIVVVHVCGWATLFSGHFIEGRKPALFDNLSHIFNAAPFVTAELIQLVSGKKH